MPQPVKVFITIDTEVWPQSPDWPHVPLAPGEQCERELSWYFYGADAARGYGIPYQLRTFRARLLKASFFVDPLFSFALGEAPLRELLALIQKDGQEIGLHLHPEWLTDTRCEGLPSFAGPLLHGYSEDEQFALIRAGLSRLREVGAQRVAAFRAGSWSASLATLRALGQNGITCDTSLNASFAVSFADLPDRLSLTQPKLLEGVWEFPVTTFIDRPPAGRRPLHVCAASFSEFRTVLEHAAANAWFAVIIVLHSFEFVRIDRLASSDLAVPQRLVARRFERLCDYLSANSDRFETCHFADLHEALMQTAGQREVAISSCRRTAMRQAQQLVSRIY
jgi:hypothetical protein